MQTKVFVTSCLLSISVRQTVNVTQWHLVTSHIEDEAVRGSQDKDLGVYINNHRQMKAAEDVNGLLLCGYIYTLLPSY